MIFEYRDYIVSYEKWGTGKEILIAFHGFGQEASIFSNISPALTEKYTVYACSLFYHGESKLPEHVEEGTPLLPENLKEGILEFCKQNNIEQFSLMGYSLGGRLVLELVNLIPNRIHQIILLAPDGIKRSFWYYFATHHFIGKKLFRTVVKKPQLLFFLVRVFSFLGLVGKKLKKFVFTQFGEEENRRKVFNVWNTYSAIQPRVRIVKSKIAEHKIKVVVFTGKYDPVLDPEIGFILQDGLEEQVKWMKIEAGHDLIRRGYVDQFKEGMEWLEIKNPS